MTNKRFIEKRNELIDQLTESLANVLLGEKIPLDIIQRQTGEILIPCNRKITKTLLRKVAQHRQHIDVDPSPLRNKLIQIISSFEPKFVALQHEFDHPEEYVIPKAVYQVVWECPGCHNKFNSITAKEFLSLPFPKIFKCSFCQLETELVA